MSRPEMRSITGRNRNIDLCRIALVVLAASSISVATFGVADITAHPLPGQSSAQGPAAGSIWIAASENGRPVAGLKKEDLKLTIGRREQTISRLIYNPAGHVSLGLLIDASGSRRTESPGLDAALAPDLFRRVLLSGNQAFVMHFNDVVHLDVSPTSDLAALDVALQHVAADGYRGGTALYDAIVAACNLPLGSDNPHRILVVITDGEDNSSRYTLAETIDVARRTGTTLWFLNVAQARNQGLYVNRVRHADGVMCYAARATEGMYFEMSWKSDMRSVFGSIADILCSPYVLDFRSSTIPREPQRIKIRCVRRDVKIAAPSKF